MVYVNSPEQADSYDHLDGNRFFGVWGAPDIVLSRYPVVAVDLHAGRQLRALMLTGDGLTIKQVRDE